MFISSREKNYSSHTFWQQKQNVVASLTILLCTNIDKSNVWWAFENVEKTISIYIPMYLHKYLQNRENHQKDEKWKNGNENAKKADDNCLKFKSQGRKRCL